MADLHIIKKEPILLAALASEIEAIGKKQKLNSIQQKTKDFAIKFSKLNKVKEAKLISEIKKLNIPRLDDEHIAAICNVMPKEVVELRHLFAGSKTTVTPENLVKIQEVLKRYEK